jgi:hypothetical protein
VFRAILRLLGGERIVHSWDFIPISDGQTYARALE